MPPLGFEVILGTQPITARRSHHHSTGIRPYPGLLQATRSRLVALGQGWRLGSRWRNLAQGSRLYYVETRVDGNNEATMTTTGKLKICAKKAPKEMAAMRVCARWSQRLAAEVMEGFRGRRESGTRGTRGNGIDTTARGDALAVRKVAGPLIAHATCLHSQLSCATVTGSCAIEARSLGLILNLIFPSLTPVAPPRTLSNASSRVTSESSHENAGSHDLE
jgi:hypothetical protein